MLPSETDRVWNFLQEQPVLAGFVLVGGSALALRIHHRRSEDLDLLLPEVTLPRARLEAFLRIAAEGGFDFQRNDNEAALLEFAQGGIELHDHQQDFLVNRSVKISFFTPDAAQAKVFSGHAEGRVRIATLTELFASKSLISASRSKSRDWLDLYLLMRDHGFSIRDYQAAFREAGVVSQCDIGLSRLCSGVPQRGDEGYHHLLANPPKLDEMTAFFSEQRNWLEVESAAEALRSRRDPGRSNIEQ